LSKGATVLAAISLAGGPTRSARPENTVIVRQNRQIPINLKSLMLGRTMDVPLLDGDEVRVTKSSFVPIVIADAAARRY